MKVKRISVLVSLLASLLSSGALHTQSLSSVQTSITRAINQSKQYPGEVWLANPHFKSHFTPAGIAMRPSDNPLIWKWRLASINGTSMDEAIPQLKSSATKEWVDYDRGNITERYLFHHGSIEQQFIIHAFPDDGDLEIHGLVQADAEFKSEKNHWEWGNATGSIRLGALYVYDANSKEIPAIFEVSGTSTTIFIEAADLAQATLPVTIDPEIGPNDFRISFMGGTGDEDFDGEQPAIAYNTAQDEYLVVWRGDEIAAGPPETFDNEREIYGQRLNGDGTLIGNDFRISDMAPGLTRTLADNFQADQPAVAYNAEDDNYLVVWRGEDNAGDLVDREREIYGRIISGVGTTASDQFRISQVGVDGDISRSAQRPDIAYNRFHNEFLVVWEADDTTFGRLSGAPEIYGQRISATGEEIGPNDFNISNMGPDDLRGFLGFRPAISFNPNDTNYLVCWQGIDLLKEGGNLENEIYGQFISAKGQEIGPDDFRISKMGPDGDFSFVAFQPDVVFNPTNNTFMVVWSGSDDAVGLVAGENEIFGRFVSDTGTLIGIQSQISDMGPEGNTAFSPRVPKVAFNTPQRQFLVVWEGVDDSEDLDPEEIEIFGQYLDQFGEEIGENDFRISNLGPAGDRFFRTENPALVYNNARDEFLVVFDGEDDQNGLVRSEKEVFGQRITGKVLPEGQQVISDARGDSDPAVAFNSQNNQYLIVWSTNDDPSTGFEEFEIFGQLFEANGDTVASKFRISDMGPITNDFNFDAFHPAVAYNASNNNYLVVWEGDNDTFGMVNEEFEIFGQLLDAAGNEIGTNDFRISDMGPTGDPDFDASLPRIEYNPTDNNYLVVWHGDDTTGNLFNNREAIFGQLINADGSELGSDFQISNMEADGRNLKPDVTYNDTDNEYLITWIGPEINPLDTIFTSQEILGKRLTSNGGMIEAAVQISENMGNFFSGLIESSVTYNSENNQYMVAWEELDFSARTQKLFGQLLNSNAEEIATNDFVIRDQFCISCEDFKIDVTFNAINKHYLVVSTKDITPKAEIFGQRISTEGALIGSADFQISDVGNIFSNATVRAFSPQLVHNPIENEYLVAWDQTNGIGIRIDNLCPASITDITLGTPIADSHFIAENIASSSIIAGDGNVTFDISGSVNIFPEFGVEANGMFQVLIDGCGF